MVRASRREWRSVRRRTALGAMQRGEQQERQRVDADPDEEHVGEADLNGQSPYDVASPSRARVEQLLEKL